MAELVKDYVERMRSVQPEGPYNLLGWSFGANAAHAIAVALRAEGQEVALLAMLDGYPATDADRIACQSGESWRLAALLESLGYPWPSQPLTFDTFVELAGQGALAGMTRERLAALAQVFADSMRLRANAEPDEFDGDLLFFRAARGSTSKPQAWQRYLTGAIDVHDIDATHGAMTQPEPIDTIGAVLARHIGSQRETS